MIHTFITFIMIIINPSDENATLLIWSAIQESGEYFVSEQLRKLTL